MASTKPIPLLESTPVPATNAEPLLLGASPGAFWIARGSADIFLAKVIDGQANGARFHLVHVAAEEVFFGMECGDPDYQLLCVGSQDAVAKRIANFSALPLAIRAALLDRWLEVVLAKVCRELPPREYQPLQAGKEFAAGESPRVAFPISGLVWCQRQRGEAVWMDRQPLPAEHPVPVSRAAWVRIGAGAQISCSDTQTMLASDEAYAAKGWADKMVLEGAIAAAQSEEAELVRRTWTTARRDQRTFAAALAELSSTIVDSRRPEPAARAGDALLSACEAVGQRVGLRFRLAAGTASAADSVPALARAAGVRYRQVVLKDAWWTHNDYPLVGFWDASKAPVALLPRKGSGYDLFDPAEGTARALVDADVAALSGMAYQFYPKFADRLLTLKDVFLFGFQGCGADLKQVVISGALGGLVALLVPVTTGVLFDTIIPGAHRGELKQVFALLAMASISTMLLEVSRGFAMLRTEGKMDLKVQAAVWDRLLRLPAWFFRQFSSGDLATRSLSITYIRQLLTGNTIDSALSGAFSLFSCALMFYYAPRLALVAASMLALAFGVTCLSGWMQVRLERPLYELRGKLAGRVLQLINGVSKFRVSATESRAFAAWAKEFSEQRRLTNRARTVANRVAVFNAAFPVLASAVVFFFTSQLAAATGQALGTGTFLAFQAAFFQTLVSLMQLSACALALANVVPLYERARPILTALPEEAAAQNEAPDLEGHLELSHVSFRYKPDRPLVLDDLSLSIRAGEFVAIVGASGCGKSTLFRLLLGFERPEAGSIGYDGLELSTLDAAAVRRQIGIVLQNSTLISGNIFVNIVGSLPLTLNDAWDAARMAGLDRDLEAMPMGMHTMVGEGGMGLSGGQRQRLMIARALVRRPRILLLDEATSALDNQTQAVVSEALDRLRATRLVIAHRLSTVMHADRIVVLDRGRVVQQGAYEELLRVPGVFEQLAKRQLM